RTAPVLCPVHFSMRFDTSQHMKLGQHMKLAPRMIQSMEILQMPLLQLEERIAQELESNATLELVEPGEGDAAPEGIAPGERGSGDDGRVATETEKPLDAGEASAKDDFER